MEYRRKNPHTVQAVQYDGQISKFCMNFVSECLDRVIIVTRDGVFVNEQKVKLGDWVVQEDGNLSVYTADKFEILFERVMPAYQTPTLADIA